MKKFTKIMALGLALFAIQVVVQAQSTGWIGGTVTDPNGAVVPGASITVKGEAGQQFSAVTNDGGGYRVPSVQNGVYVVTITAPGFKTSTFKNVKVDVGTPITVDAKLEIGGVGEIVEISSGGEVLQTQTASVGTTITGRQITDTPIASRDALDLVGLLPGTATVGRPRSASINGLPKGALTITIDGVDVQDNLLRSSDGYFTYVRPRVDAIEEVTVSTANPGAESGGDGAVQIKFVTRRGTNDYSGGLFYQTRNEALNANYWYLNRDPVAIDDNGKSMRQKLRLNQYGGHFSGPIPFLNFGEGVGAFDSGKNKRFFFVNYEEFRQPESLSRTRTVLTPDAQAGIYSYIVGGATRTANVYQIAAANGQLATPDPTVAAVYNRIRTAVNGGSLTSVTNSPNILRFNFTPTSSQLRKFLALRFDINITKNHAFEVVLNRQDFDGTKDFLNSRDERFPGFPYYSQKSKRNSYAYALRSTLSQSLVNELRYAIASGDSSFFPELTSADFDYMGGRSLGVSVLGSTSPTSTTGNSGRSTPTYDLTDSVTWVKGSHSINFGGQYKRIRSEGTAQNLLVPTVGFGLDSTDSAYNMFNLTTMPGATSGQIGEARSLYAVLVGRVLSFGDTAYLDTATGKYVERGISDRLAEQKSYGLFIQDSWRVRPGLTLNYGIRWQPQTGFIAKSFGNYTRLESFDQVYGLSGLGNIFKPGTLTGSVPRVVPLAIGEKAYPDDMNNLAPTLGVVWSPNFGDSGVFRKLFGASGKSVFRAGYSISYVREGTNLLESIYGSNPGGSRSLSRSLSLAGSFTVGTNLRDANNPNLTPFGAQEIVGQPPAFPITLTTANSTNAFSPDIKTGSVASYSFGYQRELDPNTVIEFRYVGNQGRDLQRQYNINEFNTIENGFADEFMKAQANLYANIQAGRGNSFAYFGPGTNTSPLPIMLSYFNTHANYDPANPARYTSSNFANSTLVTALSRNAPNIFGFSGTSFENSASRRANAIANGRPSNFFYVNPTTGVNGSYIMDNSSKTWYNSGVIEVRRRLSHGLRIQANYVFSKAQANAYASSSVAFAGYSLREDGLDLAKNVQAFDLRHQFKFDATYDIPIGRGRALLSNANWLVEGILGGWSLSPTLRWQSGSPFSLGNVQLVGMTVEELQKSIKVRKEADVVYFLPDDIILNTQRAYNISVANTGSNNGYGTTYGAGGPSGRFIAPAGYGNCVQRYAGKCGFNNLIVYGPGFFKLDASLAKTFKFSERGSLQFRATFLDALNHPNFRIGGWGGDVIGSGVGGSTFGQMGNGSAYQDVSTTNDPGGRLIDLMLRLNW